jgi:Asp-tRNA(Asn)/Glu-tRNA(Gln) amidotransferase A subunit family amidase
MSEPLWALGLRALRDLLAAREVSAVEACDAALARADAIEPVLNPFAVRLDERARAGARRADARRAAGDDGALLGLPVTVKDVIWVAGVRSPNGSRALREFVPACTAVAVQRLEAAGAVVVAKTTNPELCIGAGAESALFGRTNNPWDIGRTPGGSSSGAAAALAAGVGVLALGSDDGGSIRIPAAFCGVCGHKPTLGAIPRLPGFEQGIGTNVVGPLARSAADLRAALPTLVGRHEADRWSLDLPDADAPASLDGLVLAFTRDLGRVPVGDDVADRFVAALAALERAGARLVEASPTIDSDAFYLAATRPGMYAAYGRLLERGVLEDATAATIAVGRDLGQHEASAALYRCEELYADYLELFASSGAAAFVHPTLGFEAPRHGEWLPAWLDEDALSADPYAFVSDATLTGLPACSVPMGAGADGLPVALQLTGRRGEDDILLAIAAAAESELLPPAQSGAQDGWAVAARDSGGCGA